MSLSFQQEVNKLKTDNSYFKEVSRGPMLSNPIDPIRVDHLHIPDLILKYTLLHVLCFIELICF